MTKLKFVPRNVLQTDIDKLPSLLYHEAISEDSLSQSTCCICMQTFAKLDTVRMLPCKHMFHLKCIDNWLTGGKSSLSAVTRSCPICKMDVLLNIHESKVNHEKQPRYKTAEHIGRKKLNNSTVKSTRVNSAESKQLRLKENTSRHYLQNKAFGTIKITAFANNEYFSKDSVCKSSFSFLRKKIEDMAKDLPSFQKCESCGEHLCHSCGVCSWVFPKIGSSMLKKMKLNPKSQLYKGCADAVAVEDSSLHLLLGKDWPSVGHDVQAVSRIHAKSVKGE